MRKLFLTMCLLFAMSVPVMAMPSPQDVIERDGFYAANAALIASGTAEGMTAGGATTLALPVVITGLIANQVDPWHPLACALFGDEGRVGNDTESACKH